MKTTLELDDDLIRTAQEFTGVKGKSELVGMALKTLVEREASRRLAALGGSMPEMADIPRQRSAKPKLQKT